MKLTKRQLRRIIREEKQKLLEFGEPFPENEIFTPEQQMMVDLIADILMNGTGLVPVACESAAEEIVNQLQKAGYC